MDLGNKGEDELETIKRVALGFYYLTVAISSSAAVILLLLVMGFVAYIMGSCAYHIATAPTPGA